MRFSVCPGAGNGAVTTQLAPLAREVIATETSWPMAARLRQRGLPCLLAELPAAGYTHDLVSCLNVLDRTARPLALRWVDTSSTSRGLRIALYVPGPPHLVGWVDTSRPSRGLRSVRTGHAFQPPA